MEKHFSDFQLEEYKNISNSHFEAVKQVSIFFRYYLLILAAPVFIFTFVKETDSGFESFFSGELNEQYYYLFFFYFFVIGWIGVFIFRYILNLRLDAILYAKAVNKVRKYFYHHSDLSSEDYSKFNLLPLNESKPYYDDKTIFSPLIFVFILINNLFIIAGFYFFSLKGKYLVKLNFGYDIPIDATLLLLIFLGMVLIHLSIYWLSIENREKQYLKTNEIGIDIDGVLNNQTEHFIKYAHKLTGKKIDPKKILEIPVHLNNEIDITQEEERLIFNCKEYWENLEPHPKAFDAIVEMRKVYGLNVKLFTRRDWPQFRNDQEKSLIENQLKAKGLTLLKSNEIHKITKKWLHSGGLNTYSIKNWFDYYAGNYLKLFFIPLVFEKGNPYKGEIKYQYTRYSIIKLNRIVEANQGKMKIFIEDFPENAIKMANYCDYVILFNQPYNEEKGYNFPKNVLRVESWKDILRKLKTIS